MTTYGVYIGRFQPFHRGHQHIISTMRQNGHTPIVLIGSAQESRTTRNPFTYEEREAMLRAAGVEHIFPILDSPSNLEWVAHIVGTIRALQGTKVLYLHDKPSEAGKYGLEPDQFISSLLIRHFYQTIDLSDTTTPSIDATSFRQHRWRHLFSLPFSTIFYLFRHGFLRRSFWTQLK